MDVLLLEGSAVPLIERRIGTNRYFTNTIFVQSPYHGSLGGIDGVRFKLSALSARRLPQARKLGFRLLELF
jgi:hypothetical protein